MINRLQNVSSFVDATLLMLQVISAPRTLFKLVGIGVVRLIFLKIYLTLA